MAANDYLMRQIEDMARFLGKVLFVKTEETIPLFDEQGNVLESGLLYKRLCAMLEEGEISKEDYDKWRYHYPEFDKSQNYVKVPPQDLF